MCPLPDQLAELLQIFRHGRLRIFSSFVLEHDIALVSDVTQQLDDPSEIRTLLRPPPGEISTLTWTTTA